MADHRAEMSQLPHALEAVDDWHDRLQGRVPALFLDYDGVLTHIKDNPRDATLDADVREAVIAAANVLPVAVISGRDLDDVREMVDVDDLAYAGSHGLDMLLSDGTRERMGDDHLDDLDSAERELHDALGDADGVLIERKRYAIAVHTRRAPDQAARDRVAATVDDIAGGHDRLRVTGGREVHELRPDIEWDKGRALRRLAEVLELDADVHPPVYIGDDLTDEDAFEVIVDAGVGVVVAGADERLTAARLRLDDPDQTPELLRLLTDLATKAQTDGE